MTQKEVIKIRKKAVRKNNGKPAGKRELNKERNKEAILKAALNLFKKKGFERTTTKEIAQKAKIAEGTIFNYFKTKDDLALYFYEKEIDAVIESYHQDEYLQKAPLEEKLFAIIAKQLEYIAPYESFMHAVLWRAMSPQSKLNPLYVDVQTAQRKFKDFLHDILKVAAEQGEIPKLGDMGVYLFLFYDMGVFFYWLHDRSPGKEQTQAFLDRSLKLALSFVRQGSWEW